MGHELETVIVARQFLSAISFLSLSLSLSDGVNENPVTDRDKKFASTIIWILFRKEIGID